MSVYAGASAQERQAGRRARLLDAGLELVGERGWPAATVRAVCAQARLTPRYFYESFDNREGLLIALFDGIAEEAATRVLQAVVAAPADAEAKSRAAVQSFVGLMEEDPRKARVLFVEGRGIEAIEERRHQVLRTFARLIRDQGRDFYRPPAGADRLLDTTAFLLAGGLAELLLAWLDGELESGRDELVDDVSALLAATGEAAARIARERTG